MSDKVNNVDPNMVLFSDTEYRKRTVIDSIFSPEVAGPTEVYGFAYDKAADYLREVSRRMGEYVGWKDKERPYDFSGCKCYYVDVMSSRADICYGDEVVASFFPRPDGRLGFENYDPEVLDYPKGVNPWYPLSDIMHGKLCLESLNLEKAAVESHHGQEVIYGLRFGDDIAFGVRPDDLRLRHALCARESNIRFVDEDRFFSAVNDWLVKDAVPGFEGAERPMMVRYAYDGEVARTEREVNLNDERELSEGWSNDWNYIDGLREEGQKIRRELQESAGIDDERLFRFSTAIYPNCFFRDDALFLSTECGRASQDFMTVVKGKVSLYRGYDETKALSAPARDFESCEHARAVIRKVVLGPDNVRRAAKDWDDYKRVHKLGVDVAPAKGVKR